MEETRIALIVGNGLSINFGLHHGIHEKWNTQEFLSWDIKAPNSEKQLLSLLPALSEAKKNIPHSNDFEIFEIIQDHEKIKDYPHDLSYVLTEARHYLTFSFSKLSKTQRKLYSRSWLWHKWLKLNKNNITCCYSLNYDLLLETALERSRITYTTENHVPKRGVIPILKPHGSVDFESIGLTQPAQNYPLISHSDMNATGIYRLPTSQLEKIRVQPLCIAPNENNYYIAYPWQQHQRHFFFKELRKCTHCIFVGISYFECDRPELDEVLKSIPPRSKIIVANPNPNDDFLKKIEDRYFDIWESPKGPPITQLQADPKNITEEATKISERDIAPQYIYTRTENKMVATGKTFKNEKIILDSNKFFNCTFINCLLVFRGNELPTFVGCIFDGSRFDFSAQAGNTLAFLQLLYHGGFSTIIEDTFDQIRDGALKQKITPPSSDE